MEEPYAGAISCFGREALRLLQRTVPDHRAGSRSLSHRGPLCLQRVLRTSDQRGGFDAEAGTMIAAPSQTASPNRSRDPLTLSDAWAPTADALFVGRVRRADR